MSGVISANTLFHFTKSLDIIESILRNDFIPKYSLEDHTMFFSGFPENSEMIRFFYERAVAMVCFCDIPLSHISNHCDIYGNYAIGLKKSWGIKNKICPVNYVVRDTNSTISMAKAIQCLAPFLFNQNNDDPRIAAIRESVGYLDYWIHLSKPYTGSFIRERREFDNVNFYNEREWRYIPEIETVKNKGIHISIKHVDYLNENTLERYNIELDKYCKLVFSPSDVKYIIVETESQIADMIDKISSIEKHDAEDLKILSSKVISIEQIKEDF